MQKRPTPELIARAQRLRDAGYSYKLVASMIGWNKGTVFYLLNPEKHTERKKQIFARRQRKRPHNPHFHLVEKKPPEADYMARLAEIPPDTRNLSQRLMGEPVPGRSALDRRQA